MKSRIKKIKTLLLNNYPFGAVFLVVSGLSAYSFLPDIFYPQKTGIVESIEERTDRTSSGGGRNLRFYNADRFVFTIEGEEYRITKTEENSSKLLALLGGEITFHFFTMRGKKFFREIVYNGEVVNPIHQRNQIFILSLIVFLLSLFWCAWVLVLKWRQWIVSS